MINRKEKLYAILQGTHIDTVRELYINRVSLEHGRNCDSMKWMENNGFETVQISDDALLTADGREILRVHGRAWALRPDVHAARLQAAIVEESQRRAKTQALRLQDATESIAAITCPQMSGGKPCGGTLNRAPVCPSCVTGKMGYKYRYTCESCGFDIVTREELR